mmetsp:Transcript_101302/g.285644  ORF Transcript_101302/g.285644 Transcript_101302/m.285644 type:complete len:221 (-) Transcript_101302:227-889(-)
MMDPVADTGNSNVSATSSSAGTSALEPPRPPPLPSALAASTMSRIILFAVSTVSACPRILNSHVSKSTSSASTRAPLFSRISLIVTPCFPMMRPMRLRWNVILSTTLSPPPLSLRLREQLAPSLPVLRPPPLPRPPPELAKPPKPLKLGQVPHKAPMAAAAAPGQAQGLPLPPIGSQPASPFHQSLPNGIPPLPAPHMGGKPIAPNPGIGCMPASGPSKL